MKDDVESQDPFPDLDASSALRAAFKKREPSSVASERAVPATPLAIHAERTGYELEGEIARGGMGVIVKAFDRDLTRDVALKVLRDELAHEPRYVRRFLEEGRITARLDHPGIVPVHEAGRDADGRPYFAMRLVRGRHLLRIIELSNANREGWSRTRALSVFLKVCEAMAYAHDKGVIHRDLKPSNVMVGEFGEVYVMDWGLARVVDRVDAHDLRLHESSEAAREPGGLNAANAVAGDSPIVTLDGEVLGTPCYMSPEQAQGRIAELGPRSDVYSVGAMLYHLLGNEMPYVPAGSSIASRAVLAHLALGPPRGLDALGRDLPAELIAISERAMARDPRERYPDMLDMAGDLRAFLEGRVVRAYETGAWAEAKTWVRRNQALATSIAAALLALVCGLVASLVWKAQSDENATLAHENAEVASRNERDAKREQERAKANEQRALASETIATDRAADVLRLSALQDLDDLSAEADRLWPADAEMVPRYRKWLDRAQELVDELPNYETKLAEMRAKAAPWTAEQEAERRAHHPKVGELERAEGELAYLKSFQIVGASSLSVHDPSPEEVGVDLASLPPTAVEVARLARPLIDRSRSEYGAEAIGLCLARQAVVLAAPLTPSERAPIRDTLAWALYANGRFDEAKIESERALQEAGPERAQEFRENFDVMRRLIWRRSTDRAARESALREISDLEAHIADLKIEIERPPDLVFADTQDRWWHSQLDKLVIGLKAFGDPQTGLFSSGVSPEHGWGVQKRLEFGVGISERSVSGEVARAKWSEALASIRDERECPMYHGLVIAPQLGLLPLGRDLESGLWEFAHLQTGEPPERGADGKLILRDETGLLFVLLPGGTFYMGAESNDPKGQNFDPNAVENEGPVVAVTLAPFFIAKFEMTQGEWRRFAGKDPSFHEGTYYFDNWSKSHRAWSLMHPVEQVSWSACVETLARSSLVLPTEAQWEYACRAGTSGSYSSGDAKESLQGVANLCDAHSHAYGRGDMPVWEEWLDDGETLHGEIGSYRANAFGLHDMHGNVFEWCLDRYGDYGARLRAGDGENQSTGRNRVLRGGSYGGPADFARSAYRFVSGPDYVNDNLGVRPARSISP